MINFILNSEIKIYFSKEKKIKSLSKKEAIDIYEFELSEKLKKIIEENSFLQENNPEIEIETSCLSSEIEINEDKIKEHIINYFDTFLSDCNANDISTKFIDLCISETISMIKEEGKIIMTIDDNYEEYLNSVISKSIISIFNKKFN